MLNKIKNLLAKRAVVAGVVTVVVLVVVLITHNSGPDFSIVTPTQGTLIQSVKATGQVTSKTDLSLSFGKQGIVKSINVSVGDRVSAGRVLATLDAAGDYATLTKAKAALAAAEAKLQKTLAGSSDEEVALAQALLDNAKTEYENTKLTQSTLVSNAYNNLLNSNFEALPAASAASNATAPTISGVYNSQATGSIIISIYSSGSGTLFSTSGLISTTGSVSTTTPQPIGDSGIYILFSDTANIQSTNWTIEIPNKKASNYLANKNAYESALKTEKSAVATAMSLVKQREAELALKLASARDADVALAEADVLSARGEVERVAALYEDNIIRAAASGTITRVDVKYGELANANEPVIVLQDVSNLYVEALINESNIAAIGLGQVVDIDFDALPDEKFTGVVSHIDPASETDDGVVNYKIQISIDEKNDKIRPGMNSEVSILINSIDDVLSIPRAAILEKDGQKYVNVITDAKRGRTKEVEVTTGARGDGNMVEILTGLSANDRVALIEE